MTNEEAASELLAVVKQQQVRTRRVLRFGWMIAGLAGIGILASTVLDAAGWSSRWAAIACGAFVVPTGVIAERMARRNNERFGVDVGVSRLAAYGFIVGLALGLAYVAIQNDERPLSVSVSLAIGGVIVAMNMAILLSRRNALPRWWHGLAVALGIEIIVAALAFPDSSVGRSTIAGVALVGYALFEWWRAGRRARVA
jgi:membrane associated rhomboid family serine protease